MKAQLATVLLAVSLACLGCFKFEADIPQRVDIGGRGVQHNSPQANSPSDRPTQLPLAAGGSWVDIAVDIAGKILGADGEVLFFAYDTLAYPKKPVQLGARAVRLRKLQGVQGVTVDFLEGDKKLATAVTDADGFANISWKPPKEGDFQLQAKISAVPEGVSKDLLEIPAAPLLVSALPQDANIAVVDLDRTVVDAGFHRVLLGEAEPMPHSAEVLSRIAERYKVVYLTHRVDLLTVRSKDWLQENGYPRGPLLVSDLSDILDSGKFKSAKLAEMIKAYPNVKIGIGDKPSDAQAYVVNGITAYLIPHYDRNDPKDMRKLAVQILALEGKDRLHVVDYWRQIEQSVFEGQKYPPEEYARNLVRRAALLESVERGEQTLD